MARGRGVWLQGSVHMGIQEIEQQARLLAHHHRQKDPEIVKVLWFPDESEVRLVELDRIIPSLEDDKIIQPFYFRPAPRDQMPAPTAIALIRPEKEGQLELPAGWGTWDDARELTD